MPDRTLGNATSPVSAIEAIEKAMEGVTPDRIERLWWFVHILDRSCGTTNANDDRWNWINAFCFDFEDDTFNRAAKLGFIRVTHNSLTEDSTARLTDAGRAFAAYFSEPPSAALARQAEALQRENAELRKTLAGDHEIKPLSEDQLEEILEFEERFKMLGGAGDTASLDWATQCALINEAILACRARALLEGSENAGN